MPLDVDVLVVGCGGGGATAALSARLAGAEVVAVDEAERPGGNTLLSSGSIPAAGTASQRDVGIEDRDEWMTEDILRQSAGDASAEVVDALARSSAELVSWLVEVTGLDMAVAAGHRHVGHRAPRLHAPRGKSGRDLFGALMSANRRAGVDIIPRHVATELLVEGDTVVGARVGDVGGPELGTEIRAQAVILATGGFAASRALLARYCPELVGVPYYGSETSTGGALTLVEGLDVALSGMSSYSTHATFAHPSEILLTWTAVESGGVLLNAAGSRFCDETAGYSSCGAEVLERAGGQATVLFDQRIYQQILESPGFTSIVEMGGVKRGETLADIAESTNLPLARIAESIATVDHGSAPLAPPFFAVKVRAGLLQTQGGLAVDGYGRARRGDGSVFAGLYAVGGAARGVAASAGGHGYSSGSGLLTAIGLGRLAGLHASALTGGQGDA